MARSQKKQFRLPHIYNSSFTDPYQPIEQQQQLTRELLAVMVTYQPVLVIQTRSPMIVRDIDLLQQFEDLRINLSMLSLKIVQQISKQEINFTYPLHLQCSPSLSERIIHLSGLSMYPHKINCH